MRLQNQPGMRRGQSSVRRKLQFELWPPHWEVRFARFLGRAVVIYEAGWEAQGYQVQSSLWRGAGRTDLTVTLRPISQCCHLSGRGQTGVEL